MATQAQKMGSVKDIQAHLRPSRPDTTANECMQELPESVPEMVGSVNAMLMKGGENSLPTICNKKQQSLGVNLSLSFETIGGHSRIRTYDFHRVKVPIHAQVIDGKSVISR